MINLFGFAVATGRKTLNQMMPSESTARLLAQAALACQLTLLALAVWTNVILYADGSAFSFGISLQDAWSLHWENAKARYTVYLLVVRPTEILTALLDLSPVASARLYALFFFSLPVMLFGTVMALAWKNHARLLILPVIQYALSNSFAYGFPSEAVFSPGFLWICLFLILRNQTLSFSFFVSFSALCFTHEVAIPSALLVAGFAVFHSRIGARTRKLHGASVIIGLGLLVPLSAVVIVQLLGGADATSANAIYIVDPRRFLRNPTMWLLAAYVLIAVVLIWRVPKPATRLVASAVLLVALSLPHFMDLVFAYDFVTGRYSAARTYIGGFMGLLTLIFLVWIPLKIAADTPQSKSSKSLKLAQKPIVTLAVSAALAISLSANLVFLSKWDESLDAISTLAAPAERPQGGATIGYSDLSYDRRDLPEQIVEGVYSNEFRWSLPFLSLILSDGASSNFILYDGSFDYSQQCVNLRSSSLADSRHRRREVIRMRDLICSLNGETEVSSFEPSRAETPE